MLSRKIPTPSRKLNLLFDVMKKFLKSYKENFSKFMCEDGWFFLPLLFLNFPIFCQPFAYGLGISEGIYSYYFGAVEISIFCQAVYFGLSNFPRAKIFLQKFILVVFSVFCVIDIFLILKFHAFLQKHIIQIILETNFNESKEFIQAYLLKPEIIAGAPIILLLIFLEIKKLKNSVKNLSEKFLSKFFYFNLISFFLAVAMLVHFSLNPNFQTAKNLSTATIFGRTLVNVYSAVESSNHDKEIFAKWDNCAEKITVNNSTIPYVVFVLGEATTRNHMQLYGYNLENNPLLLERYKRGEIFKFNDVIACGNHTREVMELLFTFSEKEDAADTWHTNYNLFDIARRAGYHTAWISNQTATDYWGNMDKMYSMRCDEKFFAPLQKDSLWAREPDSILFPALEDTVSRAHEKNFYCLHLHGTHSPYQMCYPAEFAKFTAADEDKPTEKAKEITAEYDNAVLYNDFIMDEIFKRFEDKNALIIYISDHGQEMYENGSNFAGHSDEIFGNRSMIEIPMLVWTSKSFREMYPEKIDALKNSVDNPYRTDLIIHTILDLMDIETETFDATKSIVNEKFDKFRPRIYNNSVYKKN